MTDMLDAVDCSLHSDTVSPIFYISGTGVVTGYVGSAGLAVLVALFQYLYLHDPTTDPWKRPDAPYHEESDFGTNVVDKILLGKLRFLGSKVLGSQPDSRQHKDQQHQLWKELLAKYLRVASDLQLLIGLSLLVSGYAQLQSGLVNYHWILLIYLAWFSALTQQAFLTSRRSQAPRLDAKLAWRLLFMGIFTALLATALVLSTNAEHPERYTGRSHHGAYGPEPAPGDYALCSLVPRINLGRDAVLDTALSVLMVLLGFVIRVARLYRLGFAWRRAARKRAGEFGRNVLCSLYERPLVQRSTVGLGRLLLYRPLLAIFLAARVVVEVCSSTFFDTIWLLCTFIRGMVKLARFREGAFLQTDEWTFGQILPLGLLAVPFLVATSSFLHQKTSHYQEPLATPPQPTPPSQPEAYHPDTLHSLVPNSPLPANDLQPDDPQTTAPSSPPLLPNSSQPSPSDHSDLPHDPLTTSSPLRHLPLYLASTGFLSWSVTLVLLPQRTLAHLPLSRTLPGLALASLPWNELLWLVLFLLFSALLDSANTSASVSASPVRRRVIEVLQTINFAAAGAGQIAALGLVHVDSGLAGYGGVVVLCVVGGWGTRVWRERRQRRGTGAEDTVEGEGGMGEEYRD